MRLSIQRLAIRWRLLLLAFLLSAIFFSLAAYLNSVASSHVRAIERLTEEQRQLYAIETLRYDISRYTDLLEARAIAAPAANEAVDRAFNQRIADQSASLSIDVRRLADMLKSEDLYLVNVYLRDIETAYENGTNEASGFGATTEAFTLDRIERIRQTLEKIVDVELAQSATIAETIAAFGTRYEFATRVVITVLIISVVVILMFILNSISRPLNAIFGAIENIDSPDAADRIPENGPAEFVQISKALQKHIQSNEDRRAAEDNLVRSETRFRDFAEASADIFWETDTHHLISWYGSDDPDMDEFPFNNGQSLWDIARVDPTTDPRWRSLERSMNDQRPFRDFEFRLTDDDLDKSSWWQFSGAPYQDDNGHFAGYRGVALDVSAKMEVEAHLQQTHNREVIAQITSGVAHDFNNLLAVLQTNLEIISKKARLNDKLQEMLERCLRAAKRGSRLTAQLLSLSRRQELSPQPIDTKGFLEDFVTFIGRTFPDSIEVRLSIDQTTPRVFADPNYLQDALLNLAINGRDAMGSSGQLVIEAGWAKLRDNSTRSSNMVEICVRDTGAGIPESIRSQIFDPFFSTKGAEGTGLGLSMVRGFVEQSGGSLGLESQENIGTKISMTFPAALEDSVLPQTLTPTMTRITGLEILLVEDDDDVRLTLMSLLKEMGHRVCSCETADTAYQILSDDPTAFDLLISDVVMPGRIQGNDLAHFVRDQWPHLPVILMSGYARDEKGRQRAIPAHVPLLQKPVDSEHLSEVIAMLFMEQTVEEVQS